MALSFFSISPGDMCTDRLMPFDAARSTKRRPTSHFNQFQTTCTPSSDDPPSYAQASRQKLLELPCEDRLAQPPAYTCSVALQGKLALSVESVNPLSPLAEHNWQDVFAVLQGTVLHLHRVKSGGPGKLLRSYTLQHAEIGLATDTSHAVLLPQTRLAHLIPSTMRTKAWRKDPDLFNSVKMTSLRLRVETDQIVLADTSEERLFEWVQSISAAIDISPPIDERSLPKQCTVPRRRRRRAHPALIGSVGDPAFVAEQERLMARMYPDFAEQQQRRTDLQLELSPSLTDDANAEPTQPTSREEDDLDLSAMREELAMIPEQDPSSPSDPLSRPAMSRHTTASSASMMTHGMIYASSPCNLNSAGKWQPPHTRTAPQSRRYARRCMPVLPADAARASNVLFSEGRRVRLTVDPTSSGRRVTLEEWALKPPSYRSHHFCVEDDRKPTIHLARSESQASSATTATAASSSLGPETEEIEPVANGTLGRHVVVGGLDKSLSTLKGDDNSKVSSGLLIPPSPRISQSDTKSKRPAEHMRGAELAPVVLCF